jgi:transcriptional regulator with XRE-family HTH domain
LVDKQRPRREVDSEMGSTMGGLGFNQWLHVQLRARRMTQRQLAQMSGVDHSTISRLMRGDRVPSLRTATRLAHGLGMPEDVGGLDDRRPGRSGSPMARVEYALRSDDLLRESEVREIMNVYLAARLSRSRGADTTAARAGTTNRTPPPIVVEVPGLRPRSTSTGRRPRLPAASPGASTVATTRRRTSS